MSQIASQMSGTNLRRWMQSLPPESIARLRTINLSTSGSSHVILAVAYGIVDRNIRAVNRMITALLLARLRAERAGETKLVERINRFMDEMHESVNQATNSRPAQQTRERSCGRPLRAKSLVSSAR